MSEFIIECVSKRFELGVIYGVLKARGSLLASFICGL